MKKAHLVITVAATVVVAGAGGAFAASKLDSPNARSQAIISDAAGQLNIEPSKLTSALEKAIDNQIDAAVKAGKLSADQGAALKKRVDAGQVPLVGGLGLGLGARGFGHGQFGGHGGFGFGVRSRRAWRGVCGSCVVPRDYAGRARTELMSGKTLAQIAVAHNKTADGVVSTLLADAKKKLDAAVTDKKLTADQEQTFLDRLKTLLTDVVNGKRPSPPAGAPLPGSGLAPHASRFGRPGGFGRLQVPAAACAGAADRPRVALAAQFRLRRRSTGRTGRRSGCRGRSTRRAAAPRGCPSTPEALKVEHREPGEDDEPEDRVDQRAARDRDEDRHDPEHDQRQERPEEIRASGCRSRRVA